MLVPKVTCINWKEKKWRLKKKKTDKTKTECWEENTERRHRVKKNTKAKRSWGTLLKTMKEFFVLYFTLIFSLSIPIFLIFFVTFPPGDYEVHFYWNRNCLSFCHWVTAICQGRTIQLVSHIWLGKMWGHTI